jgi:alkaline phosphatase D
MAIGQLKESPYVVMVSYDGFRFDYVEKYNLTHFKSLIESGSAAEALLPSFPSKTFPNHYTLVTGLYPGTHGLVDNSFYDPSRHEFFNMHNRKFAVDPYYYGGTPIWELARQHGIKTASYFWVGSEAAHNGHYPDYYYVYNDSVENQSRINQVIECLKLPPLERPHLITLYFSLIDDAGHAFGPESTEMIDALKNADALLGSLMASMSQTGRPVNIIVVSDHGMKELVSQNDTYIFLDEVINTHDSSIVISNSGTLAHLYIKDGKKAEAVYQQLKKHEGGFKVYKSTQFPEKWHYSNPRSGTILITADPGKEITLKSKGEVRSKMPPGKRWGVHGYDPDDVNEMRGIFYASGPNIKRGITLKPFRNVDVYPLLAQILGLKAPSIDGSSKTLQSIYKP